MRIGRKALAAAYVLDRIAGDPEWFPHPVRLIGRAIEEGERRLRKPNQSPIVELIAGGVLTFGVVATAYAGTATSIAWANRRARWLGFGVEMLLAWTCLASRNLQDEASAVLEALERKDSPLARERLARIVGRDTQQLDANEISRAAIETVAESASDGVIAPLFYLAIGGVPLAMAYKAVNTLDSLIGHADERYFYFGKVAARLDDVANLLPSRLTSAGIVLSATALEDACSISAMTTWLRDGSKHKSPNAGHPESAMAGALQVRLGGNNFYDGRPMSTPLMGVQFAQASPDKVRRAIQIASMVSVLGVFAALLSGGRRR